jgi:hypothetical protein
LAATRQATREDPPGDVAVVEDGSLIEPSRHQRFLGPRRALRHVDAERIGDCRRQLGGRDLYTCSHVSPLSCGPRGAAATTLNPKRSGTRERATQRPAVTGAPESWH